MDRNRYIELCRAVSVLPGGVLGIKKDIPSELLVGYNGMVYYPMAYELAFKDGVAQHFAILHDLRVSSALKVELSKVTADDT